MVVCKMEIPRPPPPPPPLFNASPCKDDANASCFRIENNQDETGSIYSVYKQKIDSMFESDSSSNSVQAKIEKMFSEIASDVGGDAFGDIGSHVFSVNYIGSVSLQQKVSSLAGLQEPLKTLYFKHKSETTAKKTLISRLEISTLGLKFQYEGDKGDSERLNPFPSIAVWSAVKFVLHDNGSVSYAFLPLITDPDNIDKKSLFRNLDENEKEYIKKETHSPLVAIVMRNVNAEKQLECHGFVCQTSEDAIVIAATLYKSLMAHMRHRDKKPKNKNGVTCMSMTSSVFNEPTHNSAPVRPPRKKRSTSSSAGSERDVIDISDSQPLLRNKQTPKKSTKTRRAPRAPDSNPDLDVITTYDESKDVINPAILTEKWNTLMSAHQKKITAEIKQVISDGSRRGFQKSEMNNIPTEASGDILTKVTIPRSGSFLNAGGLTRYKSKISRINGQTAGGSPLGFNELFNEFRIQEGLHSVDDILGVIIDAEGMSFNDLKPIYKEFLLKLSVTLTKDELYQRSKAIMRKQKKKCMRTNTVPLQRRRSRVNNKLKTLKHIFRKTLKAKLLGKKLLKQQRIDKEISQSNNRLAESSISTSSYDTKQFRPKHNSAKEKKPKKNNRKDRVSTSEESDCFSLRRANSKGQFQNRNSSSGYVSCSECSYDSDTCTCVSADKCYCSLGHRNVKKHKCEYCSCNCPDSFSVCACDTDSCTDSTKCYCPKGQVALLRHVQEKSLKTRNYSKRKLCKNNSNTKSSKSLEFTNNADEYYENIQSKRFAKGRSIDNLAVDYELFSVSNRNYGKAMSECDRSRFYNHASAGPCTEALAVKKAAEIAALFANIKLSQTTDIGHLIPPEYENEITRIKVKSGKMMDVQHTPNRMCKANSLYGSSRMYSAKNGLYTIQSQSDESGRSSIGDIASQIDYRTHRKGDSQAVSTNIETSLGYLP
ncbi:hypothetical protein FQA39_LY14291 [Lamprigera yunnana]|nr:hypothetical protein FQA39_LY14291 [Lamprigera yunnana]